MADDAEVRDNPSEHRYEIVRGDDVAVLTYRRRPGVISLVHTEVPPHLRERGLATRLVEHAIAAARQAGDRIVAICPFVKAYLEKHPEDADLLR